MTALPSLRNTSLGDRQPLPLAGMLQVSRTTTSDVDHSAPDVFLKDGSAVIQQASVFASGKITDNLGIFSQWTYDGVAHESSIDNVDIRYAQQIGDKDHGVLLGLTMNNNPGLQDVF